MGGSELRALAARPEDLDAMASTHVAVHTMLTPVHTMLTPVPGA